MSSLQVIVIGAGAAGLIAAGQAALGGAKTLLLEKMERPARKLRITGKGRCNFTNTLPLAEFLDRFGAGKKFLRPAFARFFSSELIAFFETLNIPTVIERGGRVFPAENRAQDIVDALIRWAHKCGVKIQTQSPVKKIVIENGRIKGAELDLSASRGERFIPADAVILATGGASYPATGSTGDGYRMAQEAGHSIIPIRPALVPLETAGNVAERLAGLALRNVAARVFINGKKRLEAFGELEFTPSGVSGPIILAFSRRIVDALRMGEKVRISIDLKPALDEEKLKARLLRDMEKFGKQPFLSALKGLLPSALIPVCAAQTGIPLKKTSNQITPTEQKRLRDWLMDFSLDIINHRPFEEALITAGGVDTREVNPNTMSSRIVENLYFAGEILDIDGDTGGFNLQAAFSTGWLAGRSVCARPQPSSDCKGED